jgi:mitochondrial import inner membrane translocase subunit TIM21
MKPTTSVLALRPKATLAASSVIRPWVYKRPYATQTGLGATTQGPRRKKVTAFNDDGAVPWGQLSATEKAARATQQSFNFGLVIVGLVFTVRTRSNDLLMGKVANRGQGGVVYFMWHDVFSPDSKISQFNRAVDKIKKDPRCLELLGNAKKISAHGDETFNKWRRARPVS